MALDRRKFIKLAGLAALVGMGGAGWELLRPGAIDAAQEKPNPRALKAKLWSMAIDMRKLTPELAAKAIEACREAHNIPLIPGKQEIKWIWMVPYENAFPETENPYADAVKHLEFPVLCNHCENPPCVRVCPTQATFKRPDGIVMMDMHRCIGCRFCMAACPYGSRSFNFRDPRPFIKKRNPNYPTRTKGVVEKCLFCNERIDQGKLPVCVEAAPEAFIFGDLADAGSPVRKALRHRFSLRRKPNLGTEPKVFYLI